MTVTIHRGTHQIGGCVTEVCSGDTRIFIDFGSLLPGEDGVQPEETMSIPGVTEGEPRCDGVFFTHTHSDHIGQLERILPNIPIYMGETAKEMYLLLNRRLDRVPTLSKTKCIAALESARTYVPAAPITVGSITVTPFLIDHSAFDAYMLLIEAEGLRVLHTGDFRLHGFRGSKTLEMLRKYVGRVDWLICEGTTLSRTGEVYKSEHALQADERAVMERNKRVFVLCSSMNIDRISAFIKAKPDARPTVCDSYQKDILMCAERRHGEKTALYRFGTLRDDKSHNLHRLMEKKGFLAFIRANDWSRELLKEFEDGVIVYSMWQGYLSGKTKNPQIAELLQNRQWLPLHTSGHAFAEDIKRLGETVNPWRGIIPIHSESPAYFKTLFTNQNIVLPSDGETVVL